MKKSDTTTISHESLLYSFLVPSKNSRIKNNDLLKTFETVDLSFLVRERKRKAYLLENLKVTDDFTSGILTVNYYTN